MKIEPGEYKTRDGFYATVTGANHFGAIGWIARLPTAWDANGKAIVRDTSNPEMYDLDIPRTIAIPETELPQHHSVRLEGPLPCVEVGDDQSALLLRIRFYNQEDAQKWREWAENNIFWTGGA